IPWTPLIISFNSSYSDLFLSAGYGNPSVTQTPAVKSAALGETVSLSCSASAGVDDDLSWYQQKPGQPPKLLFYKITSRQSDTPSHFSSSGSEPQFTLTISGVQADDVGDYYCMGSRDTSSRSMSAGQDTHRS
uniref:Ig-like domain-containing protein n=1 Tax=Poecilia reticulata TaxID=8081 RepID=A0A3P9P2Y0_POERE